MIRIERMTDAAAPEAAELEKENFTEPWSAQAFCEELRNGNAVYLTAYEEDLLVGVCGMIISYDEADVMNVSVRNTHRRQGIAEQMLKELLVIGRERGVKNFTLEVRSGNGAAIHLYEKLGFVFEGIRPRFYRNPTEDAAIYWLRE